MKPLRHLSHYFRTALGWLFPVLLMTWPGASLASSTRIHSLGGSGGFFEDQHNILRWYGSLGDYPDLAVIETGHFDLTDGYDDDWGRTLSGPGGGVTVRFDQAGRWGTGGIYFHGQASDADPGSLHRDDLGGGITALYGRNIAGVSGTLTYRHAGDTKARYVGSTPVRVHERSRDDIGLGVRFDIATQAYLDLAGEIRHISNRASGSSAYGLWDTGPLDSWDNFGLRARAFIGLDDRLALVPLAEFVSEDFTGTSIAGTNLGPATSANQGHLVRLGAGLDFFVDADNLLLFSTEYLDGQVDHTIRELDGDALDFWQEDYAVLLMLLAFESRLAHWITVRASTGYEHIDNHGDLTNPATGEHIPLGLGLGLHVATLTLDMALTDREPQGLSRYRATLSGDESATWLSLTLSYGF
jgi:hypothetical protein